MRKSANLMRKRVRNFARLMRRREKAAPLVAHQNGHRRGGSVAGRSRVRLSARSVGGRNAPGRSSRNGRWPSTRDDHPCCFRGCHRSMIPSFSKRSSAGGRALAQKVEFLVLSAKQEKLEVPIFEVSSERPLLGTGKVDNSYTDCISVHASGRFNVGTADFEKPPRCAKRNICKGFCISARLNSWMAYSAPVPPPPRP
jgi:hypothetical protein